MKHGWNALLAVVLAFGILAVLNFFSSRHYTRLDMTESGDYTLSPATVKILQGIEDIVTIKVFLTPKPVAGAIPRKRRIEDTVAEFDAAAKGKLDVDFLDPQEDPDAKKQAERWKIQPYPVQHIQEDRVEMVNTYLAMVIVYEDKDEVLPMIWDASNLEYDMVAAIKKVTRYAVDTLPQVAFLGGHGEPSVGDPAMLEMGLQPMGEYSRIGDLVSKIAHVTTVNPSLPKDKEISGENKILVVAAPKGLTDRDLYAIDQFLMKGGAILFLMDPIEVETRGWTAKERDPDSKLEEMLVHYGVRVNHDLVLDERCDGIRIRQRIGQMEIQRPMPYFLWPTPMVAKNPVTNRLGNQLALRWASSLTPLTEGIEGRELTELAWTSDEGWTQEEQFDPAPRPPDEVAKPTDAQRGKRVLAVSLRGKFPSFFKDKEVPPLIAKGTGEPVEDDPLREKVDESVETQILVVGDADFLKNNFAVPGNFKLFLNAVDSFVLNPELVSIRAKGDIIRPLKPNEEISKAQKNAFKFVNLFGIPALVALAGLARFLQRRRARSRHLREVAARAREQ